MIGRLECSGEWQQSILDCHEGYTIRRVVHGQAREMTGFGSKLALAGTLPSWGPAALPSLQVLDLSYTKMAGPLPAAWAGNGSAEPPLAMLTSLLLGSDALTGSLPPEWGSATAFPSLQHLQINSSSISGVLPVQWGLDASYPRLTSLVITRAKITGGFPDAWVQQGAFKQLSVRPGLCLIAC